MTTRTLEHNRCRILVVLAAALLAGAQPAERPPVERHQGPKNPGDTLSRPGRARPIRPGDPCPKKPTSAEMLRGVGFEATAEGLAKALESPKPFARIYALKVIQEQHDAGFLPQAVRLLKHEYVRIQLEAAKLLAEFNRAEGLEWLRSWEKRVGGDWDITAETAHLVLDSASALAARGDERLAGRIRKILQHQSWAVRIHAARTLGDFRHVRKPDVQKAWIESADVLIEALRNDSRVKADVARLYARWLTGSVATQTQTTPRILATFGELAAMDHPATGELRRKLHQQWLSKPLATTSRGERN